jgi:hypothetical protein
VVEEKEEEVQYKHNWLYSVLPITRRTLGYNKETLKDCLMLTGYCRACDNAFSVEIPQDEHYGILKIKEMRIPKWGCVGPS